MIVGAHEGVVYLDEHDLRSELAHAAEATIGQSVHRRSAGVEGHGRFFPGAAEKRLDHLACLTHCPASDILLELEGLRFPGHELAHRRNFAPRAPIQGPGWERQSLNVTVERREWLGRGFRRRFRRGELGRRRRNERLSPPVASLRFR